MGARLTSAVVQIFARDVRRSIGFYRQLGLPVPEPDGPDPHVDVALPGGNRLSFDAEQTITGMHPDWTPSDGAGRVALAFGLDSPAEVDTMFERLTKAGHPGALEPYDAP
jgi:catechol 2,3-dioxygenase-like lactoylglutathione lyase family enzyme